jgi:hypothetical protein
MIPFTKKTKSLLTIHFQSLQRLRAEGVLVNSKDFTCQIGEWLVAELYGGKRAKTNQRDWDVEVNGKKIQVKTHAKAATNPAQFSGVRISELNAVDELIIIVFSEDYRLRNFYKVPWEVARKKIQLRTKTLKPELRWSEIKSYRQDISKLPRQDIVHLFK